MSTEYAPLPQARDFRRAAVLIRHFVEPGRDVTGTNVIIEEVGNEQDPASSVVTLLHATLQLLTDDGLNPVAHRSEFRDRLDEIVLIFAEAEVMA